MVSKYVCGGVDVYSFEERSIISFGLKRAQPLPLKEYTHVNMLTFQ